MRVLGFDPGMERLGFGIVDTDPFDLTYMGVIANPPDHTKGWNENVDAGIKNITEQFPRIMMLYDPQVIVSELLPPGKLGSRSETTRAAISTCKAMAYLYGIPWINYGANTIKETIAGDGTASKARVRNAILELFPQWKIKHQDEKNKQKKEGLKRPPGIPQDAFDGAAAAVTHIWKTNGKDSV